MTTNARRQPPAEWAPHAAVWLAWPSDIELWNDALPAVQREFIDLCRAIAKPDIETTGETLNIVTKTEKDAEAVRSAMADLDARVFEANYGDIWLRDTAPIFTLGPKAHRFRFNGWGQRYELPGDDTIAVSIAQKAAVALWTHDLVLEGGAVEFDGEGTLMTTRSCLLNANRNPGRTEANVTAQLKSAFGIDRVIWLSEGLLNDHTDGHIDTLVRFVAPGHVVCMRPSTPDDPNADVLNRLQRELANVVDAKGRRLQITSIPSPGRVADDDATIMPASYVNFYIANHSVVVPTYGVAPDDEAVAAIAELFPTRKVFGRSARHLLVGGGAFHCITQQQPKYDQLL